MNEATNIRIIQYVNGELHGEDLRQFEKELEANPHWQKEIDAYREIIAGVKLSERKKMKVAIASGISSVGVKELKDYQPSKNIPPKNSGGGSNFFGNLFRLAFIVLPIVAAGLIYFDKMPIEHPVIDKAHDAMHEITIEEKVDTIYHVIESEYVEKDTIIVNVEDANRYLKELEEKGETWEN